MEMSPTKDRGKKQPKKTPLNKRAHKSSQNERSEFFSSFVEQLEGKYGEPILHSTALEEDFNKSEIGRVDKEGTKCGDTPTKRGRQEDLKKRKSMSDRATAAGKQNITQPRSPPAPTAQRHLVGKKPAKKKKAEQVLKPANSQQLVTSYITNQPETQSRRSQSQDKLELAHTKRKRCTQLFSDEEDGEDHSWKPSAKKSSSGESSSENEAKADTRRRTSAGSRASQLDTMLHAFQEFSDNYRESLESREVQESIDIFCRNVKDQVMEKVSLSKKLGVLKRGNAKTGSLIRAKMHRLLDAKHELMKAEWQVQQLQKKRVELKKRLKDMRKGQAFLHDLGELTSRYLDHRHKHPSQRETYGASCLPALLLETRLKKAVTSSRRGRRDEVQKKGTKTRRK